jgi:hypothetical protein
MSKLTYKGTRWEGTIENDEETIFLWMSDATFQRHVNAYLERIGVSTLTYLELMRYAQDVCEKRYQAGLHLEDLDYWRHCDDPEVKVRQFGWRTLK